MAKTKPEPLVYYEALKWLENPDMFNAKGIETNENQIRDYNHYTNNFKSVKVTDIGNTVQGVAGDPANVLDIAKVNNIIDTANKENKFIGTYLEFMFFNGSRVGDVADTASKTKDVSGIRISDLRLDKGFYFSEAGKRSRYSAHPLSPRLVNTLKDHIKEYKLEGDDFLFPARQEGNIGTRKDGSPIKNKKLPMSQATIRKYVNNTWDKLYPGERVDGNSTHAFRRVWATILGQLRPKTEAAAFLDDRFVAAMLKHSDLKTLEIYQKAGIGPITELKLHPRTADIINTQLTFKTQMAELIQGKSQWEKAESKRVTFVSKPTRRVKKQTQRYEVDPREYEISLREIFGQQADKIPMDQPIQDVVGKIYSPEDYEKLTKAYHRGWENYGYAKAKYDQTNIKAADNLYNLDDMTLVKYTDQINPEIGNRIVKGLATTFNTSYYDKAYSKIDDLVANSVNYSYAATDLLNVDFTPPKKLPKAKKGTIPGAIETVDTSNWWANTGLDELYGDELKVGGNYPKVKLDREVVRSVLEKFEEESRFSMIADKMSAQTSHFNVPDNIKNDGATKLGLRNIILKQSLKGLRNEKDLELTPTLGFSRTQEPMTNEFIINKIENNIENANLRASYSSIDSSWLKGLVDNNPKAFPPIENLAGKYDEDFIYRMRLEPTLQYLYSEGVIPKVTLLGDVAQQYDSLFKGNLKDKYKLLKPMYLTKKGLPRKNQKIQWLFDWRTNYFENDFATHAYETPKEVTQGKATKYLPIVDFSDKQIDNNVEVKDVKITEALEDQSKPKKYQKFPFLNMNKRRFGNAFIPILTQGLAAAALLPTNLFGKTLVATTKVGTDLAIEAAFADTSGQRRGLMRQELDKPITLSTGEEFFPNVSDAENQIKNLSAQAKSELTQMDLKDEGYDTSVDSGFLSRLRGELGEAGRRITGNTVGPTIDPMSGGTIGLPTGFRENVIEGLDESERQDQRSKDVAGARSQEVIEGYIPNLEESVAKQENLSEYRRRANPRSAVVIDQSAQEAQKELDEINEFSADSTDNQMAGLGLTSQPQGEEDATIR
jgi:integrase